MKQNDAAASNSVDAVQLYTTLVQKTHDLAYYKLSCVSIAGLTVVSQAHVRQPMYGGQ